MAMFLISQDGTSPQIEFILKTLSEFTKFSALSLNLSKCGLISPVMANEKLEMLCEKYGLKNLSNDVQTYLGYHFLPTKVMSNKFSIDFLRDSLSKTSGNFRTAGLSGRKLLSSALLASKVQYQALSWHNLRVSELQPLQNILDKCVKSKYPGNSKYLPFNLGGFKMENIFTRYLSSTITFFQKQVNSGLNEYYNSLNAFLETNLKLKIEFLFSHGIKFSSILAKTFDLMGLDRLKSVVLLYKKHVFPFYKQNKVLHIFGSEFASDMYANPKAKKSLKLNNCDQNSELSLRNEFYSNFLEKHRQLRFLHQLVVPRNVVMNSPFNNLVIKKNFMINYPLLLTSDLAPPPSIAQLEALASKLNSNLPEEIIQLYTRIPRQEIIWKTLSFLKKTIDSSSLYNQINSARFQSSLTIPKKHWRNFFVEPDVVYRSIKCAFSLQAPASSRNLQISISSHKVSSNIKQNR